MQALKRSLIVGLAASLSLPAMAQSTDPAQRGLEIAQEADRRDEGWGDSSTVMTMTLRNKQGQESTREMRSRSLEVADDGDKGLIIFDHPKDVRGTALLTFSHKSGSDDQWLYLPALKRTKRIASNNKSGPFMGSEFAYEDLSSQEVEKYTYKYLRDESYEGQPVFVIERFPVDDNSGYTRQIVWMDSERYIPLKVEFYDRKQSHLKTLTLHEYEQYKDKHWRPLRLEMVNHQTGKSTTLSFAEYEFDLGLGERDFDQGALARAR
nr:outer membrane lipoprotein-sorting protein [Oceanococcus sp. HetDA_MAG_MS8]